jgi:hypothetical protein
MPDDYHPLIPPRDPERVDLGRMQADIEFLIQRIERLRRLHDGRQCRDRHRLDRAFLAALFVKNPHLQSIEATCAKPLRSRS